MPAFTKGRDLIELHGELVSYIKELESRITHNKPYHLFGAFLLRLGFSEATLQQRGIFTAAEKKPLAERLLRAVNYAIDRTTRRSTDQSLEPIGTPLGDLQRAILKSGRLGVLTARLDVYNGLGLYDAMLRRKENEPQRTYDPSITEQGITKLKRLAATLTQEQAAPSPAQQRHSIFSSAPRGATHHRQATGIETIQNGIELSLQELRGANRKL